MQAKLLKLGSALTVAAACLNATTAPAAAGGYDDNAALINTYIQSAPWTSYSGGWSPGWKPVGDWHYKPSSYDSWGAWGAYQTHGWTPKPVWQPGYVSTQGHSALTYYDDYGDHVYYGAPAYAKRTTIVHPSLVYDDDGHGYGHVDHDAYVDDHVLHVGKHATDLRGPIFFGFGSAALTYEAQAELDKIGQIISAYYFDSPKVLILLSGFTDATGTASANEALAKARNHAVMDYLIAHFGFDASRFVLRAVGEDYANMSAMPYGGNQRRVTVSLVGLPKWVTDTGHPHHGAVVHAYETVPDHTHETTATMAPEMSPRPAPEMAGDATGDMTGEMALDKGEVMAPAATQTMTPHPVMKPAPVVAEHAPMYETRGPAVVAQAAPVNRCLVPSGPFAGTYVNGKLLATVFTDIDDYGGGILREVCGLGY